MTPVPDPRHARLNAARSLIADNPLLVAIAGDLLLPLAIRRLAGPEALSVDAAQIESGAHTPVVYFARVGRFVKIGTSTNLRGRMLSFYLDLDDVLAVIPGDHRTERRYHAAFASSMVRNDPRKELFRLDLRMRFVLASWRCTWAQAIGGVGLGSGTAVATGSPLIGLLSAFAVAAIYALRPGIPWRRPARGL